MCGSSFVVVVLFSRSLLLFLVCIEVLNQSLSKDAQLIYSSDFVYL